MSDTRVVNIHNKLPYDVYIGRQGKGRDGYFGNPYTIGIDGDRDAVIALYRIWFEQRVADDEEFRARVLALKGQALGCFCAPAKCHGDVIIEWLDQGE